MSIVENYMKILSKHSLNLDTLICILNSREDYDSMAAFELDLNQACESLAMANDKIESIVRFLDDK